MLRDYQRHDARCLNLAVYFRWGKPASFLIPPSFLRGSFLSLFIFLSLFLLRSSLFLFVWRSWMIWFEKTIIFDRKLYTTSLEKRCLITEISSLMTSRRKILYYSELETFMIIYSSLKNQSNIRKDTSVVLDILMQDWQNVHM